MITFGWVVGILLIFVGLIWFICAIFHCGLNRLCKAEAEMMRKDGLWEGEPEYMRDFRVSRAEWDIIDVGKHVKFAAALITIGTAIILYLIFR